MRFILNGWNYRISAQSGVLRIRRRGILPKLHRDQRKRPTRSHPQSNAGPTYRCGIYSHATQKGRKTQDLYIYIYDNEVFSSISILSASWLSWVLSLRWSKEEKMLETTRTGGSKTRCGPISWRLTCLCGSPARADRL